MLAGIVLLSLQRFFGSDEIEGVHTAWKILAGEKIYIDFFQHHHPFFYYFLCAPIAIFGESASTLVITRQFCLTMTIAIFLTTYLISLRLFRDSLTAILSVILLGGTYIFIDSAIEIRPDLPQTLFCLAAFYFLFTYFDNKRLLYLLLSSVCLATSFLFLQKAVFAVAIIGLMLLAALYKKNITFRAIVIYVAMFVLTLLPYLIYLIASSTLSDYIALNWLLNMRFLYRFSPEAGFRTIMDRNILLVCFSIAGLIGFSNTPNARRCAWAAVGFLLSIFLVRAPFNQYFMPAMPFMAVIAANALKQTLQTKNSTLTILLIITTSVSFGYFVHRIYGYDIRLILIAAVGLSSLASRSLIGISKRYNKFLPILILISLAVPIVEIFDRAEEGNQRKLKLVEYVLSITDEDDHIYDGAARFNVFRKDIDYFWFSVRPKNSNPGALASYQQNIADYHYDVYESIDRHKPKVIARHYIDPKHPSISNHYKQSDLVDWLYIRMD